MGKESPKFNKPSLNLAYLQDIADGNAEFMIEMIDIFLKQTPAYLAEIDEALHVEDWRTVAEISHKIRPTFAFIGADDTKDEMAKIETIARSGKDLEQIAPIFKQVQAASTTLFEKLLFLRKELADLNGL
jgi:HPt (histidine-containing phosphotransfer) domain-containing protein